MKFNETDIVNKINSKIKIAVDLFDNNWNEKHIERMAYIDGMVEILEMITGKKYIISENGIFEK